MVWQRHPSTSYRRRICALRRGKIMSFPPTSPHAKQIVTNHRLACSPADETAEPARPSWSPRAAGRRRRHPHACQNRRRAAHSWATVMRHFLPLTLPVRLLTAGVLTTPPRSLLVPLTGASQALATSLIPTTLAAVAMTAVTPRADVDRGTASVADETATVRAEIHRPGLQGPGLRHRPAGYSLPWGHAPGRRRRAIPALDMRPRRSLPQFSHRSQHYPSPRPPARRRC